MKIAFYTLGCKVNQYESQVLRQQFESSGFEIVEASEVADVYIINSCTVTSTSDKKTRQIIHRLKMINKNSLIVLTGCFPQAFPEKAANIKEADIITGTTNRNKIFDLVNDKLLHRYDKDSIVFINSNDKEKNFEKMNISKFEGKTRAFIKIQDGCNRFCSYCIIPKARGRVRSKNISDLIQEATYLSKNGHKEIVLTGINLSSFGQDSGSNLVEAVKAVSDIQTVKRVRLSSLEPDLINSKMIEQLSKIDKFCDHFHLCLQSGSDKILKKMNRQYCCNDFLSIVESIRRNFDNPSITTDLIVGFPGETDDDFKQSLKFCEKINFSRMHVFTYSKREQTRASLMPDQIPMKIKHLRSKLMIELANKMQTKFLESQIGRECEVLFENLFDDNSSNSTLFQGYSKNYTHIIAYSQENISNKIKNVKITKVEDNNCLATII